MASDLDYAATLADGYEANYAACTFRCKYEAKHGIAASLEAAKRGQFESVRWIRQLEWTKNGDLVKFVALCPQPVTGAEDNCTAFRGVATADHSFRVAPGIGFANIIDSARDRNFLYQTWGTTFASFSGPPEYSDMLRDRVANRLKFQRIDRSDSFLGIRVKRAVAERDQPASHSDYVIDPSRGFLPLERILSSDNKPYLIVLVGDIVQTPEGAWFPKRCVTITKPAASGPCMLTVYQVTELQFGPIDKAEFAVDVPKGFRIDHFAERGGFVFVSKDKVKTVHADELKSIHDQCIRASEANIAREKELRDMGILPDEPLSPRSWRKWWIIIGVTLVAGLLMVGIYRYRRWRSMPVQPV